MKFKSILIYCPHEGLFCKHMTTFVGYNAAQIELDMATRESFEFDQLGDFLTTSSAYNKLEHEVAISSGNGFYALIELAKKWGWTIRIWEGDCDD